VNLFECWQAAARALDRHACKDEKGRSKKDPVYLGVVENRDGILMPCEKYSSCADRAHWRLWRLGCRLPFVNREERSPLPNDWHLGVNISNLHNLKLGAPVIYQVLKSGGKEQRVAVPPTDAWIPDDGDELILSNHPLGRDAHSCSIVHYDGVKTLTANYGSSGMSPVLFPGCKLSEAPLVFHSGSWFYGKTGKEKRVIRVMRFEEQVKTFTARPQLDGVAFDAEFTGEVYDRLLAEYDAQHS
jgi:hypothetical protein